MLRTAITMTVAVTLLTALSACVAYAPPARGRVVVEQDYYYGRGHNNHYNRYDRHCPPGHYRKGWC